MCRILIQGFEKRGKEAEAAYYRRILDTGGNAGEVSDSDEGRAAQFL
jgi:hypothetical protein